MEEDTTQGKFQSRNFFPWSDVDIVVIDTTRRFIASTIVFICLGIVDKCTAEAVWWHQIRLDWSQKSFEFEAIIKRMITRAINRRMFLRGRLCGLDKVCRRDYSVLYASTIEGTFWPRGTFKPSRTTVWSLTASTTLALDVHGVIFYDFKYLVQNENVFYIFLPWEKFFVTIIIFFFQYWDMIYIFTSCCMETSHGDTSEILDTGIPTSEAMTLPRKKKIDH